MNDREFALDYLERHANEFVRQMDIVQASIAERGCGLTVHSRISELRKPEHGGHTIEQKNVRGWDGYRKQPTGRAVSYYRLVLDAASAGDPPRSPGNAGAASSAGVGDLAVTGSARPTREPGDPAAPIVADRDTRAFALDSEEQLDLFPRPRAEPAWA